MPIQVPVEQRVERCRIRMMTPHDMQIFSMMSEEAAKSYFQHHVASEVAAFLVKNFDRFFDIEIEECADGLAYDAKFEMLKKEITEF